MIPSVLQEIMVGETAYDLYVPDPNFIKQAFAEGRLSFPYWSQVWPSAIGLSLFLLQHGELLSGKRVLELGAGLGLPSIVAAKTAVEVLCTDKEKAAVDLVQQSAVMHRLGNLRTAVMDWNNLSNPETDIVLLSDVNYEPQNFQQLRQMIDGLLLQGITIILSTPHRLMAKDFILPLLPSCNLQQTYTVVHQKEEVGVAVLVLQSK